MRVTIEDHLNLLDPFSDQKPPERAVEIHNIGLTTSATRMFHLACLEELLAWNNGAGLRAFAERVYPEPRVNQRGPRGAWRPKEAEQYIIETWKAVQVYANTQQSTSMIQRGTIPRIVVLEDHNYHLRAGPDDTLFQTREAFDLYSRVANMNVPATLQATTMLDRRLHTLLQDKPSVAALQQVIDSANQNQSSGAQVPILTIAQQEAESRHRLEYHTWMTTQELGSQSTDTYYFQDKASKEVKDLDIALKLGHWDPDFELSKWLPSSLNEAERRAALKRERYGIWSGMNLEKIGEEGPVLGVLSKEDEGVEIDEEPYEDDVEAAASETEGEEAASGEKATAGNAEGDAAKVPASGLPEESQPKRKEKRQNKAEGEKKRKGSSEEKSDGSLRTAKRRKEKKEEQSEKKGEKNNEKKSKKKSEKKSEKQVEENSQKKSEKKLDDKSEEEHENHNKEPAVSELEQKK